MRHMNPESDHVEREGTTRQSSSCLQVSVVTCNIASKCQVPLNLYSGVSATQV